jgi:hypothetical protein
VDLYGVRAANWAGFDIMLMANNAVHYCHGQWNRSIQVDSLNYRELTNLLLSIKEATQEGLLNNYELYLFNDNSTAKMDYHIGESSSKTF